MDKQHAQAACTSSMHMQHGDATWTYSMNVQYGSATDKFSMNKQQGHVARPRSMAMQVDIQRGHVGFRFKDMQHGQAARTQHETWTCSIDMSMQHGAYRILLAQNMKLFA